MPAAVAIPFLVSTGISVAQGIKASKAAKKAAKQETQATTTALEQVAQPVYQEQRQLWNPYVQTGRGALGNLAALTGIPGPGPQEPRPNYGPGGPNAIQGQPLGQMGQPNRAIQLLSGAQGPMGGPSALNAAGIGAQYVQNQLQAQGLVRLRAPDGTVQAVPANQAQHYISLGATRVG